VEADELTYGRGELSVGEVQQEIAQFWRELGKTPELLAKFDDLGIRPHELDDIEKSDAISVRADSSGADPTSVLIIIAFAPTGNRVLKDIWTSALLPRIRRRWGDDAIGEESNRRGR
jgi:hypothetical protein